MKKLFALALVAGVFCPDGQSADDPKVQAVRATNTVRVEVEPGERGKSAESPPRYNADILEVLRKDLETGSPLEKQRALETIMALGAIRLLPEVVKGIEDPTPLPRDGDTGWGFVGHEAATAMGRLAQMIDGVDVKQRGYRAYSFHDDEGNGGAKLKASGRLAEVRRNWEQWRRNSVQFSAAIGGDFSNLGFLQENAARAALKAIRDKKVDTSRHEIEVPESVEPTSLGGENVWRVSWRRKVPEGAAAIKGGQIVVLVYPSGRTEIGRGE